MLHVRWKNSRYTQAAPMVFVLNKLTETLLSYMSPKANGCVAQIQYYLKHKVKGAGIAQSVLRLVSGWTVRGSNPGGGDIFRTRPDRPWGRSSLLYNGYRVFPGGKTAGAWRWPPTPIWRRGWRKSRAIHLLPLWAFAVCSRVNFTFTFTFLPQTQTL